MTHFHAIPKWLNSFSLSLDLTHLRLYAAKLIANSGFLVKDIYIKKKKKSSFGSVALQLSVLVYYDLYLLRLGGGVVVLARSGS